ncbi:MAG: nickel-responsive transcriptional regulator NikR [Caulobacteraceae bacterium]|nr:nickel-responsive transcriptional regulator NikR [Caulobacteraceae bacterium]
MQRVTISIDEDLAERFDTLIRGSGYQSRSEAVRDLVRQAVEDQRQEDAAGDHCVANLSYIYDHHTRDLAQRLTDLGHAHHDLVVAATHVHLDHEACFESAILKGPTRDVLDYANGVRAQRGVRYGTVNLIGVKLNDHHHDRSHNHHGQAHLSPPDAEARHRAPSKGAR